MLQVLLPAPVQLLDPVLYLLAGSFLTYSLLGDLFLAAYYLRVIISSARGGYAYTSDYGEVHLVLHSWGLFDCQILIKYD